MRPALRYIALLAVLAGALWLALGVGVLMLSGAMAMKSAGHDWSAFIFFGLPWLYLTWRGLRWLGWNLTLQREDHE